jgi:hypothetical protein
MFYYFLLHCNLHYKLPFNFLHVKWIGKYLKVGIFKTVTKSHYFFRSVKWLLSKYFLFQLSGFDHKARVELRLPSSPVRPSQLQGEDHFLEALRSPQGKPLNWWNGELGEFHWLLDFFCLHLERLPHFRREHSLLIVHKFFKILW